jgi:hypothetical protein
MTASEVKSILATIILAVAGVLFTAIGYANDIQPLAQLGQSLLTFMLGIVSPTLVSSVKTALKNKKGGGHP